METHKNETERNKAIIRRFVEEVQNNKNFDVYDELNDPDFVNLSAPGRSSRPRRRKDVPPSVHRGISGRALHGRRHANIVA
jgi:hypothetical protein